MDQLSFDDLADSAEAAGAPVGHLCECGCGKPTALITKTVRVRGDVKGQYRRYSQGHNPLSGKQRLGSGDSYAAVHRFLLINFPKTGTCEECGRPDRKTQHALIHGREYTRDRGNYRELCSGCHVRYDLGGRERDPDSIAKGAAAIKAAWTREREAGIERALPRGDGHYRAKLTGAQVAEIREKRRHQSLLSLAREYGVSKKTILNIVHRKIWKHVPGETPVPENMLRSHARRLTDDQMRALHDRHRLGETQTALAREADVSQATLSRAFKRLGLEG